MNKLLCTNKTILFWRRYACASDTFPTLGERWFSQTVQCNFVLYSFCNFVTAIDWNRDEKYFGIIDSKVNSVHMFRLNSIFNVVTAVYKRTVGNYEFYTWYLYNLNGSVTKNLIYRNNVLSLKPLVGSSW